jgi:hypothetical protein
VNHYNSHLTLNLKKENNMFSKNSVFIKLVFLVLILFGTQAQAHNIWQAVVVYGQMSNPSNRNRVTISEPSLSQCTTELRNAINNPPPDKIHISNSSCMPFNHIHGSIPDPRDLQPIEMLEQWPIPLPRPFPWPWPWPCLSCPPFDFQDNILQRINPGQTEKVKDLMDKYNIDAYNKEVINLQQQYDLEGFDKELNNLHQNIDHK